MEEAQKDNLMGNLFEKYILQMRAEGKSNATIRNYRFNFDLLKKWKPGVGLTDLTSDDMSAFMVYLDEREKQVGREKIIRPLKNSSRATVMGKLGSFFNWLVVREHLKQNPYDNIKYPQVSYTDRRAFTKKEFDKICLSVMRDMSWETKLVAKRNIAIVMLLAYTGLRRGELLGLRTVDLYRERKEVRVRAETSKSKMDRVIGFNQALVPYLEEYLFEREDCDTPYFLVSNNSDRNLTEHGLKHLNNKLNNYIGINCHWHRFRHTFAVNLYRETHDPILVQRALGHKSFKQTLVYLRSIPDDEYIPQMRRMTVRDFI